MSKLFFDYLRKGYGPKLSFKLARNRVRESVKQRSKASAEVIAKRLLDQNIWGAK